MRKTVFVALALALSLCLFGCSSPSQSTDKKEQTTSTQSSTPSSTEKEEVDELEEAEAPETSPEPVAEPVTLTGSGDDVLEIPEEFRYFLATIDYTGDSNFVVKALAGSGDRGNLLVNEIGAYKGTVTNLLDSEASFLEVKASGKWTIVLKPISAIEPIENGKTYSGDNVLMVADFSGSKAKIKNNGESNFVVKMVNKDARTNLLVNEIGSYEGTVVCSEPLIFVVMSSGNWSISW